MTTNTQPDLTYKHGDMFTTFYAETEQGSKAWKELSSITDGTGKCLRHQASDIILRLRFAGYIVEELKDKNESDDELLYELFK
tara:strand:+ start:88518 stop:88766 length:249 start_codon:yes stop_codon:yes gene_type:complete